MSLAGPGAARRSRRRRVVALGQDGAGIELLQKELLSVAGWHQAEDVFIARERHLAALRDACAYLDAAERQLPQLELFAEEMRLQQACAG